ncbi:MAG: hypothetical protein ACOY9Y_08955 [Bacillota bacterium]
MRWALDGNLILARSPQELEAGLWHPLEPFLVNQGFLEILEFIAPEGEG